MATIVDDKSTHCIPYILKCLEAHQKKAEALEQKPDPFFVGLQGVQGAGKTTLVETLCNTLSSPPHNLPCIVLSIDDLYLPHSEQLALAERNSDNSLVQHRGQPGTHDIELGRQLFRSVVTRKSHVKLPSYDKSAFAGAGDRRPSDEWNIVNKEGKAPVEVVIFEGWCVGFRPLSEHDLEQKWQVAKASRDADPKYNGQLGRVKLEDVQFVNRCLRDYDALTDQLTCFIQIDAVDTQYVYEWREQQEAALRQSKGSGMSVNQVRAFVDGYYPAYELYADALGKGIFRDEGRHLRLVVDRTRKVVAVHKL